MTSSSPPPPELSHNLEPDAFMWLWARYVVGFNTSHHCTWVLRGKYSKALSGHNRELMSTPTLLLGEQPVGSYLAIYVCGVAKQGYAKKTNYPHNLHAVIAPSDGASDEFNFERWQLRVRNGVFLPIPPIEQLPAHLQGRPPEFITCRIFRWAAVAEAAGAVSPPPVA